MLPFGKREKRLGFKFIAGPKYLREAKTTQHTPIPLISSKIFPLHLSRWSSTLFETAPLLFAQKCVEHCTAGWFAVIILRGELRPED